MIKLCKFDGDWIVSGIEEIPDTEFGDPDCMLQYPYVIDGETLTPYPPYGNEREFIVRSSELSVVTEPKERYFEMYLKLVEKEKE